MAVRITDDRWRYDKMRKNLFGTRKTVLVGITEEAGARTHHGAVTMLMVAIWNELGTLNSPSRPILRGWFDNNKEKATQWLLELAERIISAELTREEALKLLGEMVVKDIKRSMTGLGIPPPNALSTIKKKGHSTATVEEGALRDAMGYVVKEGTGR
jgi:hypothetical protein